MLNVVVFKKENNELASQFSVPLIAVKYATEFYDKDAQDQLELSNYTGDDDVLHELLMEIAETGWLSNPDGSIDYMQHINTNGYTYCASENYVFYFGRFTFDQLKAIKTNNI